MTIYKKPPYFKVAFSLLELIFVIALIAIISSTLIPKTKISKLQMATHKIVLYLNYTRYIALIDDKFDTKDDWELERWTIKFKNCTNIEDGIFYRIYSDKGHTGKAKKEECLKDPLTNKYLYTNYCDEDIMGDRSKYILLTKEFSVEKVEVSCYSQNGSKTIGKISFGNDGQVYLSSSENSDTNNIVPLDKQCTIKLFDEKDNFTTITIEPKTGYIHKL